MSQRLETRNVMVVGVWAFVVIWLVGMLMVRGDLLIAFFLFFVAVAVSVAATLLPTATENDRLQDRKASPS